MNDNIYILIGDSKQPDEKENLMITANSQTPFLQSNPKSIPVNGMLSSEKLNSNKKEDLMVNMIDPMNLDKSKGKVVLVRGLRLRLVSMIKTEILT